VQVRKAFALSLSILVLLSASAEDQPNAVATSPHSCPEVVDPGSSANAVVWMARSGTRQPLVIVDAQYPPAAIQQCVSGWVALRFPISDEGVVGESAVISSHPRGVFVKEGIKALQAWKYAPLEPGDQHSQAGGCALFFFHHRAAPVAREPAGDPFPIECPYAGAPPEPSFPRGPLEVLPNFGKSWGWLEQE
jgi:TonB family protein